MIFVIMVIYRSNFTNIFRDNRYWNRATFKGKYGKIPIPLCPGALSGIESGFSSLESDVQSGLSSAGQAIASGTQSVAQDISSMTQSAAGAIQGTPSASVQNTAPATTAPIK
jgi:hypothetical protein